MHATVDYANYENTESKDAAAVKDCLDYLGDERFNKTVQYLRNCQNAKNFRSALFALSMSGISGYPIHALGRIYCNDAYNLWMSESRAPVS